MKKLMFIVLVSFVFVSSLYGKSSAESGATAEPTRVDARVDAGVTESFPIKLKSSLTGTQNYKVTFVDFNPRIDGAPELLVSGGSNKEFGLKSYLSGPSSIALPSSVETTYEVSVAIPADADSRTRYGAVLFTPVEAPNSMFSIGVIFIITTGESSDDLTISSLSMRSGQDGLDSSNTLFRAEVQNNSLFYVKPTVTLDLLNRNNEETAVLSPVSEGGVLPKSSRIYEFAWPDMFSSGDSYTLTPRVLLPNGVLFFSTAEYVSSLSDSQQAMSPSEELVLSATERENPPDFEETNGTSDNDNNALPIIPIVVVAVVILGTLSVFVMRKKFNRVTPPAMNLNAPVQQNQMPISGQSNGNNVGQIGSVQQADLSVNSTVAASQLVTPQPQPQPQPQPITNEQHVTNQPQPPQNSDNQNNSVV